MHVNNQIVLRNPIYWHSLRCKSPSERIIVVSDQHSQDPGCMIYKQLDVT